MNHLFGGSNSQTNFYKDKDKESRFDINNINNYYSTYGSKRLDQNQNRDTPLFNQTITTGFFNSRQNRDTRADEYSSSENRLYNSISNSNKNLESSHSRTNTRSIERRDVYRNTNVKFYMLKFRLNHWQSREDL